MTNPFYSYSHDCSSSYNNYYYCYYYNDDDDDDDDDYDDYYSQHHQVIVMLGKIFIIAVATGCAYAWLTISFSSIVSTIVFPTILTGLVRTLLRAA
jgi:hypothetical protein